MEAVIMGASHLKVTPGQVAAGGLPAGNAYWGGPGRQDWASVAGGGPTNAGVSRRMGLVRLGQLREKALWGRAIASALGLHQRAGDYPAAFVSRSAIKRREMAGRWMRPDIARWPCGLLASVLLVGAVSGLQVLFKTWLVPLRVLYILAVVPVAVVWGTGLAVLTAVLSAVAYEYLFVPPIYTFDIADWRSAVALGVFLVTAVVVGGLAGRLRRAAVESGRLSQQQAALRRVATLVAWGAPPPEVFSAVAHELAAEFGANVTAVLRYEDDGTATIVGGWAEPRIQIPAGARLKTAGHGAVSVLRTGAAVRVERFDGPPGSAARFFRDAGMTAGAGGPIIVGGRLWGLAVAASRNADAFPAGTETRIADFTELVAAAIANAETQVQLVQSRARVVATADSTRQQIERDLHDGAQQQPGHAGPAAADGAGGGATRTPRTRRRPGRRHRRADERAGRTAGVRPRHPSRHPGRARSGLCAKGTRPPLPDTGGPRHTDRRAAARARRGGRVLRGLGRTD